MVKEKSRLQTKLEQENLLKVYFEIQSLKNLLRQGWLQKGIKKEKCESVADHSFSTTLLAWLIADEYFSELDKNKIIQYTLVHEMGEIYAGDITPADGISEDKKYELELESVEKIFQKINQGEKYIQLWKEFENSVNEEAKFVKQIDKLEMALQAHYYEDKLEIDLKDFKDTARSKISDENLLELLELSKMF